ncbi:MAG: carbon-nitrogen hydrolase family protein [Calditrichaeota bacterium]|nr:MAG: carbon-nitrogen hydrolase family protein [Calditrichota bacterium]
MRIACIQQSAGKDTRRNLEKGLRNARIAAQKGARIIAFAELAFTPFYPQTPATSSATDWAEPLDGPTVWAFRELARELGVVFVLNFFERDGDKTYDTSPVIDADGTLLGSTRMIHITDYEGFHEKGYYTPGDHGVPVYHTAHGVIGVAICYDRHYPEYMRALAIQGAEIVFVPQAGAVGEWPEGLYEAEMRVAAFQNGYFTALVNRVGREAKLTFAGASFVCNPMGKVIARAPEGREEILWADISPEMIRESPARRLFFRDRRPELYAQWL